MIVKIKENSHLMKEVKRVRAEGDVTFLSYGMSFGESVSLFVQLPIYPSSPSWVSVGEFTFLDDRVSRHWVLGSQMYWKSSGAPRSRILSFPQMANDDYFYESLIEGNPEVRSIWNEMKSKMDIEFALPEVNLNGTIIEGRWVQCSVCCDVSEVDTQDEVFICPNCASVQRISADPLA